MKSTVVTIMALAASDPVLTRDRLARHGVGVRRLKAAVDCGLLRRQGPGTFLLGGPEPPDLDRLAAAARAASQGPRLAVVSHRSAAVHWEAHGVVAPIPEVTVVARQCNLLADAVVHRTDHLAAQDRVALGRGLEVTSPPKTMLDLGAVCTPDAVERAFEHLFFRGLISWKAAKDVLRRNGGRGRRGAGVFRAIIDARDPDLAPPESELELAVSRFLLREGIRVRATQVEVRAHDGSMVRIDFLLGERKVLEANGYAWHAGRADKERNERKQRLLVLAGYEVLPCSWVDLTKRRQAFADEVRAFVRSGRPAAA
jgi:hypothetical protein